MKIEEFERSGRGNRMRYVRPVGDDHELVIAGSKEIPKVFKDADFDVQIEPEATAESWERELRPVREQELNSLAEVAALEQLDDLFKKRPAAAKPEHSAFISLRRTRGTGTSYLFSISNFFLPTLFSVFGVLPPICSCFGVVTPLTGDQDLFLELAPFGPILRMSAKGGTAVDVVTLTVPCTFFTHFVPWFQVFGFASGTCSNFTFGGTDIFG